MTCPGHGGRWGQDQLWSGRSPAWCHLTGHLYLGTAPGNDRPLYALSVRADARRTEPHAPWRSTTD
ncbi:hypothetical protein [Nonomuraea aridisoli]|uniref:hypothetical protein n=1 Tax=Nonomuraea aridisoli TaxID=2070368 RepID=UPI0011B93EB1|nr:hypothetical protein [Nonomuraea aridisoli]